MEAMNDKQRAQARTAILSECVADARTIREILNAPPVVPFVEACGQRTVKELVYALANSGLLFQAGATQGSVYIVTKAGKYLLSLAEAEASR